MEKEKPDTKCCTRIDFDTDTDNENAWTTNISEPVLGPAHYLIQGRDCQFPLVCLTSTAGGPEGLGLPCVLYYTRGPGPRCSILYWGAGGQVQGTLWEGPGDRPLYPASPDKGRTKSR